MGNVIIKIVPSKLTDLYDQKNSYVTITVEMQLSRFLIENKDKFVIYEFFDKRNKDWLFYHEIKLIYKGEFGESEFDMKNPSKYNNALIRAVKKTEGKEMAKIICKQIRTAYQLSRPYKQFDTEEPGAVADRIYAKLLNYKNNETSKH